VKVIKKQSHLFVIPTAEGIPSEESGNLLGNKDFRFHGNDRQVFFRTIGFKIAAK